MTLRSKQIMVVEDERIVQMHLAKIVQSTGHHLIGSVERSQDAIDLARQQRPDLVLMDIRLGEGDDGIECAKVLTREHGAAIVFITAHSSMETLTRAMPVGAAGYLVKPFRVAEVSASITSALATRERERRAHDRERALSSAVDALEEAIFVLDSKGTIGFANPRGKKLSGWSENGDGPNSLFQTLDGEQRLRLQACMTQALGSHRPQELEALCLESEPQTPYDARLELISESEEDCLLVTLRRAQDPLAQLPGTREPGLHASGSRLLVYSHDTFGLGHIRRCMNLIRAMSERVEDLCTLLVTGSPMAHRFELPPRTDYLKLPAVRKVAPDAYEPRSLGMSEKGILTLRRNLLERTIGDYSPDFLLVDHSPTGMNGELIPALNSLRVSGGCQRILGLRDIIDSPARVAKLWQETDMFNVLRQNYDHIVVYGSESVYDTTREYGFPEDLRERTQHVNYVSQERSPGGSAPQAELEAGLVVVSIGGGDGGGETVVRPFLEMMQASAAQLGIHAEVLLGPFVDPKERAAFQELAAGTPVVLRDFVPDPLPLFARAELVISTAGYNICAELLAHAHRALLIPRVVHREEQLIRARRLAEMGLVEFLHPEQASSSALTEIVSKLLAQTESPLERCREAGAVPLDGAERMAEFLLSLMRKPTPQA